MTTPEEALAEGLRVLTPGQGWKTTEGDMVVAEILADTDTVVMWVHTFGGTGAHTGRFIKKKIRIARFMLDYAPALKR